MASIVRCAVAFLFTLTALVSAQSIKWPPNPIPLVCHDNGTQIIAVVGTNVTASYPGNQSYGLTTTFIQDIMADIPNSDNFSLNYDRYPPYNQSAKYFIPDVTEGLPQFQAALKNYTTACPNTPLVIHGYSEGGVIVMNALCGTSSPYMSATNPISTSYVPHIIAVVLYGEETWVANQSYTTGECYVNAPTLARQKPQACAPFAPVMKSYCFANDIACCGSANASAPWPYNVNPHWLYPFYHDGDATRFVVGQYKKWQNGTLFTTSTSSSTVISTKSSSSSSKTSSSAGITTTPSSITSSSISKTSSSNSTITSSVSKTSSPSTIASSTTSSSSTTSTLKSTSSSTTSTTKSASTTTTPKPT